MSNEAIRNELIDWISKLEDQGLLDSLLGIKKATQQADWADDLSPEERMSIERGLNDVKNGRVTPSKEFWARHGRYPSRRHSRYRSCSGVGAPTPA